MGLGKTIQTLSFLGELMLETKRKKGIWGGPFLVVAPATTLVNWQRECSVWLPWSNCIVYVGNQ